MKLFISNYAFNAASKTVTFSDYGSIALANILLITNTTANVVIYDFTDPAKGGTVATNVLTLTYNTASMNNTDKLQIWYEDGTSTLPAGTAIIGKVGIDQTTPGTTNGVQVNAALPAGTNAIGKLAANDGVDIGDITINNAAGASAVNIQDGGNSITVDQGTATNLKTQAENYQGGTAVGAANPLQVTLANGSVPSHAVTNAGTFAVQDSEKIADNAAFTDGTTKVNPVGYIYDEVAGTALTENDIAAARITANRAQVAAIEDGATRGRYATVTASNALKVDASGVAVPITDNAGSLTVDAPVGTPVFVRLSDGSSAIATLPVSMATNTPVGTIAHDSADSGAPLKVGSRAKSALSGVTLVASDDRTDLFSDLDGALIVRMNGALGDAVNGNASNTDGSSTSLIAAQGVGIKTYITEITITNTSANNIYVELKDGSTVKWTFPVPANGGVTHQFITPLGGTANTAWNFDPSAATTTVYCSAGGFKSKI